MIGRSAESPVRVVLSVPATYSLLLAPWQAYPKVSVRSDRAMSAVVSAVTSTCAVPAAAQRMEGKAVRSYVPSGRVTS